MIESLSEFHFIRPYFLLLLVGLPLLYYFRRRISGTANEWRDAIDPALLRVLMPQGNASQRPQFMLFALLAASLAIVGLAGPTVEKIPQPVQQRSDALVVVLDLSASMLARDLRPSRMERAKQKVTDILQERQEGFTSLVAYAGDAHAVAPMTDDTETLLNLLQSLHPNMMPMPGSRTAHAIRVANLLLNNVDVTQGRILVVTDGIDYFSEVTRELDSRFPLSILGVGTTVPTTIPMDEFGQPGTVLSGPDRQPVKVSLDEGRLNGLASLAGGRYKTITIDDADIDYLLEVPNLTQETIQMDRDFDQWEDLGYLLVIPLLLIVLFFMRRGVLVALLVFVALPNDASVFDEWFKRKDQQAYRELIEGRPEKAAELFEHPQWKGVAKYRVEDFPGALEMFQQDESLGGNYNLANTLAKSGDLHSAIALYAKVLESDPTHEDALFNKQLLEKYLEQQQQNTGQSNQEGEPSDSQESASSASQSSGDSQELNQEESQEGAAEGESAESTQEMQQGGEEFEDGESANAILSQEELDSKEREEQATFEQWLRAIPDAPGNVLKRKFEVETQERLRNGELRRNDDQQYW